MLFPQEIIRRKRAAKRLSKQEIDAFVTGIASGAVSEGQAAAFAMAVCLNGMDMDERVMLTHAMARSGATLDWSRAELSGPVLDKHSTGGVGDKVSLILGPVVAACGGFVPMISGRGLGHTGGTLDKLDSIPGYSSQPDLETLRRVVRDTGCAIVGATTEIAPADRRLYAIRDVTATVESLDLITASILSKKLAAGLDGLVMDVKFGSGAFLPDLDEARGLAQSIAAVAAGAGLPTTALLTDMNAVLGHSAGNAVEVRECIDVLRGQAGDPDLLFITVDLAAELLVLGRLATDLITGRRMAEEAITSGRAADRFARMVHALGGPTDLLEAPERHLPVAPIVRPVMPSRPGRVAAIDVRAVGMAVVALGGGRTAPSDGIDHAVGLTGVACLMDCVAPDGAPLAVIHARTEAGWQAAADMLHRAYTISDAVQGRGPLIQQRIRAAR